MNAFFMQRVQIIGSAMFKFYARRLIKRVAPFAYQKCPVVSLAWLGSVPSDLALIPCPPSHIILYQRLCLRFKFMFIG